MPNPIPMPPPPGGSNRCQYGHYLYANGICPTCEIYVNHSMPEEDWKRILDEEHRSR